MGRKHVFISGGYKEFVFGIIPGVKRKNWALKVGCEFMN